MPDFDINTSDLFAGNNYMQYRAKDEQAHCFVEVEQCLKTSIRDEAAFCIHRGLGAWVKN
jgi:hypothetical protein